MNNSAEKFHETKQNIKSRNGRSSARVSRGSPSTGKKQTFPRQPKQKRSSPLRVSWEVRRTVAFYSPEFGIDKKSITTEPAGIPRNSKKMPVEYCPTGRKSDFVSSGTT